MKPFLVQLVPHCSLSSGEGRSSTPCNHHPVHTGILRWAPALLQGDETWLFCVLFSLDTNWFILLSVTLCYELCNLYIISLFSCLLFSVNNFNLFIFFLTVCFLYPSAWCSFYLGLCHISAETEDYCMWLPCLACLNFLTHGRFGWRCNSQPHALQNCCLSC